MNKRRCTVCMYVCEYILHVHMYVCMYVVQYVCMHLVIIAMKFVSDSSPFESPTIQPRPRHHIQGSFSVYVCMYVYVLMYVCLYVCRMRYLAMAK